MFESIFAHPQFQVLGLKFYQPFVIGDYIKIQPLAGQICEGRVASINLRYVSLEIYDKRTMIPNSTIVSTPVVVSKKPIDY